MSRKLKQHKAIKKLKKTRKIMKSDVELILKEAIYMVFVMLHRTRRVHTNVDVLVMTIIAQ
jgi:hypothetical protein